MLTGEESRAFATAARFARLVPFEIRYKSTADALTADVTIRRVAWGRTGAYKANGEWPLGAAGPWPLACQERFWARGAQGRF